MKRTIKGYVTYTKRAWETQPEINFLTFDPRKQEGMSGYAVVKEHEVEIEVPDDFDPRPELIKGLQERQKKARADFEKLCTEIQRQISELQALEDCLTFLSNDCQCKNSHPEQAHARAALAKNKGTA